MDPLSGSYTLTYFKDSGCVLLKDSGTIYDETTKEVYTVSEDEPTSARATIKGEVKMKKDASADCKSAGGNTAVWDTSVQALSEMWADEKNFHIRSTLIAFHQTQEVFSKTWNETIERFYV